MRDYARGMEKRGVISLLISEDDGIVAQERIRGAHKNRLTRAESTEKMAPEGQNVLAAGCRKRPHAEPGHAARAPSRKSDRDRDEESSPCRTRRVRRRLLPDDSTDEDVPEHRSRSSGPSSSIGTPVTPHGDEVDERSQPADAVLTQWQCGPPPVHPRAERQDGFRKEGDDSEEGGNILSSKVDDEDRGEIRGPAEVEEVATRASPWESGGEILDLLRGFDDADSGESFRNSRSSSSVGSLHSRALRRKTAGRRQGRHRETSARPRMSRGLSDLDESDNPGCSIAAFAERNCSKDGRGRNENAGEHPRERRGEDGRKRRGSGAGFRVRRDEAQEMRGERAIPAGVHARSGLGSGEFESNAGEHRAARRETETTAQQNITTGERLMSLLEDELDMEQDVYGDGGRERWPSPGNPGGQQESPGTREITRAASRRGSDRSSGAREEDGGTENIASGDCRDEEKNGDTTLIDLDAIMAQNEETMRMRGLERTGGSAGGRGGSGWNPRARRFHRGSNGRGRATARQRRPRSCPFIDGEAREARGSAAMGTDEEDYIDDFDDGSGSDGGLRGGSDVSSADSESEEESSENEGALEDGQGGAPGAGSRIPWGPDELKTRKNWRRACRALDRTILVSDGPSRMEASQLSPRQPGEKGYAAIPIDEGNNCDLARIWGAKFQPGVARGGKASYVHLKGTLGQYARLGVCLKEVDIRHLWKPGALFSLLLSRRVIRIFMSYFRIRGRPTTVSNKAANLKLAAQYAGFYYAQLQKFPEQSAANENALYLGEYRAAERREIRRTSRYSLDEKMACGKLLTEEDMKEFEKMALSKCVEVLESALESGSDPADLFRNRMRGQKLLDKWCLNFMVFLLFAGAGQRPQVFRSLLVPEEDVIQRWRRGGTNVEVALCAPFDKTLRAQECPAVMFPRQAARLIAFHVYTVRKVILAACRITEAPDMRGTLLLHTRLGRSLSTEEIRYGLGRFLGSHDPELKSITPMVLRSSFASRMFQKYKRGEVGQQQTLQLFLSDLARLMNTSPEMLMSNYIASNPLDFPSSVKLLYQAFEQEGRESMLQSLESPGL